MLPAIPRLVQIKIPFTFSIALIFMGVLLFLVSCKSMGPKTIPPDGFNYNERIADQESEQMLLNLVRLRYLEMPRFLNVASVINTYSRGGIAGVNGTLNPINSPIGANVNGTWQDRPTITYTPMTGQAFAQSLLTPLPPSVIFFMIQSGWSAHRLMRLSNSMINGLHNEIGTPGERRQGDVLFHELLDILHQLQQDGALGMHFNGDWPKVDVELVLPKKGRTDSIDRSIARFKEILQLEQDTNVYDIQYGVIVEKEDQILVQTHSIMEMLANISWYIDVPEEHIAEGRTLSTFVPDDADLINVRVSKEKPKDAFLSIQFRDHWFYIDDRDVPSKNTFAVIQLLFSMANSGSGSVGPLISIGN